MQGWNDLHSSSTREESTKSIISLTYAVRNEHWGKKGNLWSLKHMYFLIVCVCFKYMSTKVQGVRSWRSGGCEPGHTLGTWTDSNKRRTHSFTLGETPLYSPGCPETQRCTGLCLQSVCHHLEYDMVLTSEPCLLSLHFLKHLKTNKQKQFFPLTKANDLRSMFLCTQSFREMRGKKRESK